MNISIENLTPDFVVDAYAVEKRCLSTAWSEEDIQNCISNKNAVYNVAIENRKIIGICCFYIVGDDVQLINIAVLPEYREKGIGSMLMDSMLEHAEKSKAESVSLEVETKNISAIKLYENKGFVKVGIRKNFYAQGDDAYIMQNKANEKGMLR